MAAIVAVSAFAAKSPSKGIRILALGDSLTAGFHLPPAQSYPAQLERTLINQGFNVKVVNGGVSGDTTGQVLGRVDWVLSKQGPFDFVLLCAGANDGLRMAPLKKTEENLRAIVEKLKKSGARILLLGMKLPTNFDLKYRNQFERMYREIARSEKLPFLPFLLEGVAMDHMLNLEDQMHPNAQGYTIVAKNVMSALGPLLPR